MRIYSVFIHRINKTWALDHPHKSRDNERIVWPFNTSIVNLTHAAATYGTVLYKKLEKQFPQRNTITY